MRRLGLLAVFLLGCSSPRLDADERAMLERNARREFDREAWAAAAPEQRGEMLASLFRTQEFKRGAEVTALLGQSTCYIDYEDAPCFEVQLDGAAVFLSFGVAHSGELGRIISIELFPRDTLARP